MIETINPTILLSNYLKQTCSFSDSTFEQLFSDQIEVIANSSVLNEFKDQLESFRTDKYFVNSHIKKSFYLYITLFASELIIASRKHVRLSPAPMILPVELSYVFYDYLSFTTEGMKWATAKQELLSEVWLYIRSQKGRFSPYLNFDSLERDPMDELDDEDENDHFTQDDEEEIESFFGFDNEVDSSDEALVKLMKGGAAASELDPDQASNSFSDDEPDDDEEGEYISPLTLLK